MSRPFQNRMDIDYVQKMISIADAFTFTVMVIGFPKETTDRLYGQFSPAVVISKPFVVR